MTSVPPQPPQNPYPGQPGGYGPPQEQFPQYTQPAPQYGAPQGQPPAQPPYGAPQGQPQQYDPQHYQPYVQPQQQGQFPQQQQFQQPGQFPQQFPQQQFQPGTCRFCGGYPAVDAIVRGHQGIVIVMRFLKLQGPFCKTCGTASVRNMTANSLVQGWWGFASMIINPVTMIANLITFQKFKRLPDPQPGPGRPMELGKPLIQRPQIFMALIPIAIIAAIVIGNLTTTSTSEAVVGQCVQNKGTDADPEVKVLDCSKSDAEFRIIGKIPGTTDGSRCDQFPGYEASYTVQERYTRYTLCLGPK